MIEIEKKFSLHTEQKKRLLEGSVFLREEFFFDVYYDSLEHLLMKKGFFLRRRNLDFLLKETIVLGTVREEITDEKEIRRILELSSFGILEKALEEKKIFPLYKIETHRQKYQKEGFVMDVDEAIFPDVGTYSLCEIELMVETKEEVPSGLKKLDQFIKKIGLEEKPIRGKILELLYRQGILLS
ncbi:MAG: CYTH domain-containing protein [Chlamydiota bacterium]